MGVLPSKRVGRAHPLGLPAAPVNVGGGLGVRQWRGVGAAVNRMPQASGHWDDKY